MPVSNLTDTQTLIIFKDFIDIAYLIKKKTANTFTYEHIFVKNSMNANIIRKQIFKILNMFFVHEDIVRPYTNHEG